MQHSVPTAIKKQALGRQSIAPGAPDLLVITFKVLWHVGMDDEAHVGFVNAHAECDGRDDNWHIVVDKPLLVPVAFVPVHASMIGQRGPAIRVEFGGNLVCLLAFATVDDPGLAAPRLQKLKQLCEAVAAPFGGEKEVLAVKAGHK